eukprot:TRINITY_DN50235_c0_g1_i1.p1 TRINITY_DN50235_c0_g1~~TRINITY_DN50235_c0_g1_i1.p1  ORF type:complete len:432 (+),score=114.48 TRINITY_DN50235_c0_g1_i1:114-1298(+)
MPQVAGRRVVISCENIHKTYLLGTEGVPALRGVNLDIYEGEFCVIYGTSGGGKTTLLNILGTIDTPTKGNLAVCGRRITSRTPDSDLADLRLNTLGFVFQTFNLLATLTAAENVGVPMVLSGGLSAQEREERVKSLLASVGMDHREDHYPSMLSGGEQQRVTIARAMANNPRLLLLDEPTGDLDTRNTKIVLDLLLRLNREHGVTLVMVTHDPELKWLAHRAVFVRDGKIGRIEEIPAADNEMALARLRDYLARAGMAPGGAGGPAQSGLLPGGLESTVAVPDPTAPPLLPGRGGPAEEVRRPDDYETFSLHGVQQQEDPGSAVNLAKSSVFRQLFHDFTAMPFGSQSQDSHSRGAAESARPGSSHTAVRDQDVDVEMDERHDTVPGQAPSAAD